MDKDLSELEIEDVQEIKQEHNYFSCSVNAKSEKLSK